MEFVVEDPQRTGGITAPTRCSYDEVTEVWSLRLDDGGRDELTDR